MFHMHVVCARCKATLGNFATAEVTSRSVQLCSAQLASVRVLLASSVLLLTLAHCLWVAALFTYSFGLCRDTTATGLSAGLNSKNLC